MHAFLLGTVVKSDYLSHYILPGNLFSSELSHQQGAGQNPRRSAVFEILIFKPSMPWLTSQGSKFFTVLRFDVKVN